MKVWRENLGTRLRQSAIAPGFIALIASTLAGCAQGTRSAWNGPPGAAAVKIESLPFQQANVRVVRTDHYKIETTIADMAFLNRLGQLMEGACEQYASLVPGLVPTAYPMDCYIFAKRTEWSAFTRRHTGADAAIYLQINRGGYTIHDWYVAYYIGETSTLSVAAHEGWHQFVARHFKGRLPPFLEEGLACTFEDIQWDRDLPRFNEQTNPSRAMALRKAIDANHLWPLEQLISMHAGQVVREPGYRIEAFYAQDWAFAQFLRQAENGKYRPALQRLLADTAAGTVYDPTGSHRRSYLPWNPAGVKPMLEHYLGMSLPEIDAHFAKYMHSLAYDGQWWKRE